jgi:nitrogen regulatory protein PII
MSDLRLITCVVLKGKGDSVITEAMNAGAQGATYFTGKGTGIRQALGLTVIPEKDIIFFIAKGKQTENVLEAVKKSGNLLEPGGGFVYVTKIESAFGFLEDYQIE